MARPIGKIRELMDGSMPLPEQRQERYALLVAGGASFSDAAREAGYKGKNSGEMGRQNNMRPHVQSRINWLRNLAVITEFAGRDLTKEWVIEGMKDIIRRTLLAGEHGTALRTLELLGKHMGMFKETKEEGSGIGAQTGDIAGLGLKQLGQFYRQLVTVAYPDPEERDRMLREHGVEHVQLLQGKLPASVIDVKAEAPAGSDWDEEPSGSNDKG